MIAFQSVMRSAMAGLIFGLPGDDQRVRLVGFAPQAELLVLKCYDAGKLDQSNVDAIVRALEQTRYNKTAAAKLLGMTFRALRYRVKKLGIE